ncbi:hypothetical protein R5R35_012130 [Gryllus longicercus]|uniref:LON peptidase N-terminal domain and RING finger protein 2 n=1 Tax=Gryllus longicercus TaxID=2509291 RepID=A0AAN9W1Y7_9ORTH
METSPLLLSLRCHALHLLDRHREALVVADKLRHILPSWSRGHYWRGCCLLLACRPQEALTSLLLAVALSAGQAPPNPAGMPCPHTLIQAGLGQLCSLSEVHLQLLVNWISKEITRLKRLESKSSNEILVVPPSLPPGIEEADFDCILCSRILWKPVTTPCGHTFCSGCLDRCLDHTATCPLCMAPLHDLLSSSRCISVALKAILELMLPASSLYSRELSARAELAAPAHVPVFVCTVAWPGVPCPLYVFEPRYRLLVRRCVETGGRVFGMAAGSEGGHGFVDVGTLLDVRDWLRLPDGCSLLTAVGARRFRVIARAERDGYFTARVELLRDRPSGPGVKELAEKVRCKGQRWVASMPPNARAEVERAFGHMPAQESGDYCCPPDGPAWAWWLLAILPLSPRLQVAILATTSLEKRLRAIDKTLDRIQCCRV